MTITYHQEVAQGSPAWLELRRGLLTASEMKHIITPAKLQYASNEKERGHLYELLAQRITGYVEPHYISDDMLRGQSEEILARAAYSEKYSKVIEVSFITNDKFGFSIGYSPDGLTSCLTGQIECKSRRQKFQLETIISQKMPDDYMIQVQTGLLVTENAFCDFVSYCGGMEMIVLRIEPDEKVQKAIVEAATIFHEKLERLMKEYRTRIEDKSLRMVPTERVIEQDIII